MKLKTVGRANTYNLWTLCIFLTQISRMCLQNAALSLQKKWYLGIQEAADQTLCFLIQATGQRGMMGAVLQFIAKDLKRRNEMMCEQCGS